MSGKYILDRKTRIARPEPDLLRWAAWFEAADRVVEQTQIGEALISTVFLGLDHNLLGDGPLLYETMIFGGPHDGYQRRYTTWDEAVSGHREAVNMARGEPS